MKERPILFRAPMVRAILAGTKTQTRRVVKAAPEDWSPLPPQVFSPAVVDRHGDEQPGPDAYGAGNEDGGDWIRCPYGQPGVVDTGHRIGGDRLWVRETWAVPHRYDHLGPSNIPTIGVPTHYAATEERGGLLWRPSIHMCRWASRITLEVTGVRVERLQDISEADALAEGITKPVGSQFWHADTHGSSLPGETPQWAYRNLWESINGPGSWDANPWVWVVEFKVVLP